MKGRIFAIVVTFFGCGSSEYTPGLVEARLFFDKSVSLPEVKAFRFSVQGPDMAEGLSTTALTSYGRNAEIPNIPYGYQRRITVEVCMSEQCDPAKVGDIVAKGSSEPFDLLSSSEHKSLNIFIMPRNFVGRPMALENPLSESKPAVSDRVGATVTTLFDGRILIAGGAKIKKDSPTWFNEADIETITKEAEIYDPNTGKFELVSPMTEPRAFHQAVRVRDGRVVLLGGFTRTSDGAISLTGSVEVFDPKSNTFQKDTGQGRLPVGRALFSAFVVESDGNAIVIIGGRSSPPQGALYVDVYYPGAGIIFHSDPNMFPSSTPLKAVRWNHSAVFVPDYKRDIDGKGSPAIILFGGENDQGVVSEVEAFTIAPTSPFQTIRDELSVVQMPQGGRTHIASVYIRPHGYVYLVGGFQEKGAKNPSSRVDVYSAAKGLFIGSLQSLTEPRGAATATLLDNNIIFIGGGLGSQGVLDGTAVIMEQLVCQDPQKMEGCAYQVTLKEGIAPKLLDPRAGHLAVYDATGKVLMLGGFTNDRTGVPGALYYNPD
jgi:hypothetical protein